MHALGTVATTTIAATTIADTKDVLTTMFPAPTTMARIFPSCGVDIDVKSASQNNLFSRRGPGFIPVAINGSADFSPLDIDFGTLVFEAPEIGIHPRQGSHCTIVESSQEQQPLVVREFRYRVGGRKRCE